MANDTMGQIEVTSLFKINPEVHLEPAINPGSFLKNFRVARAHTYVHQLYLYKLTSHNLEKKYCRMISKSSADRYWTTLKCMQLV